MQIQELWKRKNVEHFEHFEKSKIKNLRVSYSLLENNNVKYMFKKCGAKYVRKFIKPKL